MTLTNHVIPFILFNSLYFSKTHSERMKKIGLIFPEIFDVFTVCYATNFPPGKGRKSCAATPYRLRLFFIVFHST